MISDVGDACRREPRQKAWVAWQMKSPEISGSNSMFSAGYGGSQAQQIPRATEDCGREMCQSRRMRDPPSFESGTRSSRRVGVASSSTFHVQ